MRRIALLTFLTAAPLFVRIAEPQSTTANDSRHYQKKQTKKKSAARIGGGAAVGAAVGAIAGHGQGAAIGAGVLGLEQVLYTTITKRIRLRKKTDTAQRIRAGPPGIEINSCARLSGLFLLQA